ncbi:MAG TPA: hypothetical protein VJ891_03960 [Casimicrobiaceae bacterium]|nr:hypothetical protein [Casimicrobiaceae bacterium]
MYAIKTEIARPDATCWLFRDQKTMYGGKKITTGDRIFIFASENEGGVGLVGVGTVTESKGVPRKPDVERQTPRVSISVLRTGNARRRLGRTELKKFHDWNDGRPETELNFKLYRQATNKVVGLSEEAAAFLASFF